MSKTNKILLVAVVVLLLILAGVVSWQVWFSQPTYSAVYLRTGDLYFGRLVRFPHYGLKEVYMIQVNQSNQQNPLSIQKFSNVFWGPEDYLKINKSEVVWTANLSSAGQLAQLIKTNPNLVPPAGQQAPNQQQNAPTPSQGQNK